MIAATCAGTAAQSISISAGSIPAIASTIRDEQLGPARALHPPAHGPVEGDAGRRGRRPGVASAASSSAASNAVSMRGSSAMRAAEVRPVSITMTTRRSRSGRQVRTMTLAPPADGSCRRAVARQSIERTSSPRTYSRRVSNSVPWPRSITLVRPSSSRSRASRDGRCLRDGERRQHPDAARRAERRLPRPEAQRPPRADGDLRDRGARRGGTGVQRRRRRGAARPAGWRTRVRERRSRPTAPRRRGPCRGACAAPVFVIEQLGRAPPPEPDARREARAPAARAAARRRAAGRPRRAARTAAPRRRARRRRRVACAAEQHDGHDAERERGRRNVRRRSWRRLDRNLDLLHDGAQDRVDADALELGLRAAAGCGAARPAAASPARGRG